MSYFSSNSADILTTSDVSVIKVRACNKQLYRCLAVHFKDILREAGRWRFTGFLDDSDAEKVEDKLSADIRDEVLFFLTSQCNKDLLLKYKEVLVCGIDGRSTCRSVELMMDSLKSGTPVYPLEIIAVSYLAKAQVHVYQEHADGFKLFASFPLCRQAYSARQPIRLLYNQNGIGEYCSRRVFSVLLLNPKSSNMMSSSKMEMGVKLVLAEHGKTASDCDRNITFEQLLIDSRQIDSGMYMVGFSFHVTV